MYDREDIDCRLYEARIDAHKQQNISNAKRKKLGKPSIDSFPKSEFKLPKAVRAMRNLKTFIPYDEFESVKNLAVPKLLQYLFKNMLIYECNLIFDKNFLLSYNCNKIKVSCEDYYSIFYCNNDTLPSECEKKENYLHYTFSLNYLKSFNKIAVINADIGTTKAKQYILFNFSFIYSALRLDLSPKAKDFVLFIISLYHYSKTPKIMHSLPKLLQACNMTSSLKQSKKICVDRINNYFLFLYEWGVTDEQYTFVIDDLCCPRAINIRLNPIDCYYTS